MPDLEYVYLKVYAFVKHILGNNSHFKLLYTTLIIENRMPMWVKSTCGID